MLEPGGVRSEEESGTGIGAPDAVVEIENDEFYRHFVEAGAGAARAVAECGVSVSEAVARLARGVERLHADLERQVLLKHRDLLTHADHSADLESSLAALQQHVAALARGADKLRSGVHAQYRALDTQTTTLDRLLTTCHLLRHASKILALSKKLHATDDPPKQAIVLFEIDELSSDYDFEGITLLENILSDAKTRRAKLLNDATSQLQDSLLGGDRAKLLCCFKVFQNMQCTQDQIDNTVSDILNGLRQEVATGLNIQAASTENRKSGASRTTPGRANIMNTAEFKQKLWDNLDKLFNQDVYTACSKVIMLQNVLNELHTIGNFRSIARRFWDDFSVMFSAELEKSSLTVNQCVEIDFPKLLKCYNDLLSRLKCKELVMKRDSLTKWENSFLSKSLGKLLEPVRSMWHLSQVPNTDQVDNAVRVISAALSVSLGDKQLSISLANSVAKSIKQMNAEAEQRVIMDSDIGQIIEAPTSSQQKNADLCNALYYFSSQIKRVLINMKATLQPESVQLVQDSLKNISSLPVLQLYATSINSSLELILMTMHDEPDLNRADDPTGRTPSCSLYMKEMQQFISRCKDIYLSMFTDKAAVSECCAGIAKRCLEKFIQHGCNVRPLSNFGRAKLQMDCKHLEVALSPLVQDMNDLGQFYRQLKALNILLEKSPVEIAKSQLEGASVPYSYVMMFLFSFGGPHLMAPHVCAGWSVHKLMQWLDSHPSEKDRLEFVAGALQRYQSHVRQNNITTYDEVYPILLQLLEDGRKKV